MKHRILAAPAVVALAFSLASCVSFGAEPPPSLLTLTATSAVPAGAGATGTRASALAVYEPAVPQEINVTRVPVQVDATTIAYLQDAVWVEKPARLFKRVLMETVTAQSGRLVVEGEDPSLPADARLRGTLTRFGYDAQTSSVIVQYDAVRDTKDSEVRTRRFEAVVPGVPAQANAVGDALNQAANTVAGEVAEWIAEG